MPRLSAGLILTLALCSVLQLCSAAQCAVGDAPCYCNLIKGTMLATPSTIRPTCRKTLDFQGTKRIVDIYFPTDIGASGVRFTPWVHLHGVTMSKWWLDSHPEWQQKWPTPLGGNADASRMNALTGSPITSDSSKQDGGGLVKEPGYILVVPQGTGDVSLGQMWNSIFWPCMSETRCVDKSVDDVSFLSYVIRNMQQLLPGVPIKSQVAVSGYSNGGMMIQTLLCKQPDIANHLAGVALIGTMMGSDFASSSCKQNLPRSLPLVWVHGLKDPVLPYSAGSSLGVKALGAEAGTKLWAERMGCAGAGSRPQSVFTDAAAGVTCINVCEGAPAKTVLCTVANAGHGLWDQPGTGYSAGMMHWTFRGFDGQPKPL